MPARIVRQETPRPEADTFEDDDDDVYKKWRDRGHPALPLRHTPNSIEDPKLASIDPGPPMRNGNKLEDRLPKLDKQLIAKLDKIQNETFPNLKNLDKEEFTLLKDVIKLQKEAMVYQAIVENWTQEDLVSAFERRMNDLHARCSSMHFSFKYFWEQGKRGGHTLFSSDEFGREKENPALKNRKIKRKDKADAQLQFADYDDDAEKEFLGKKTPKELEKIQDQLDFVKTELIPFYQDYTFYKDLILNFDTSDMNDDYQGLTRSIFWMLSKTK